MTAHLHHMIAWSLLFALLHTATATTVATEPAVILAAWKARNQDTTPVIYRFRLIEEIPSGADLLDKTEHEGAVVERKLVFGRTSDKLGLRGEGESFDTSSSVIRPWRFWVTYDGKKGAEEFLLGPGDDGKPMQAYRVAVNQPNRHLVVGSDILPFLLLHSPLDTLKTLFWDTEKLEILGTVAHEDGELIEVAIPRSNPAWSSSIVVDSTLNFAPVKGIWYLDGAITYDLSVGYSANFAQPQVSQYEIHHYHDDGSVEMIRRAEVTEMQRGKKAMESSVFEVDFPAGYP